MKIFIIQIGAQTGAVANYSLLFRIWAKNFPGDELIFLCNREVAWYYQERLRFSDLPNIHVEPWTSRSFQEPLRLWFHTFGLRRYINRHKPDLILSINIGPYVHTGVPSVIQVTNSFQVCDWSLARYHPKNIFHIAMLRWFFRHSLSKCDAAIVQTEQMREYLVNIPCAPKRVAVISKSVETEQDIGTRSLPTEILQRLSAGSSPKDFTYLYVATGLPHKNHKTIVQAMKYAREQHSSLRLVLTITEKELERIGGRDARSLVESGHIVPLGWINKDVLHGLYDVCSGCVMPSILESMSSSHLEAMRWNKPQISSDLPCLRNLCGDANLYVPAEDPRAWFEEMKRLAGDPALQADLVEKGMKRILDFPQTWLEVVEKYRSFFAEVIADFVAEGKNEPTKILNNSSRRDFSVKKVSPMKILYENFGERSGALSGYIYCLRALAQEYPEDEFIIYCVRNSGFDALEDLPNVRILYISEIINKELMRYWHNRWSIKKIIRRYRLDLIWSTNIGPYIRTGKPQLLHLMNAFQWCDPSLLKYHPQDKLHVQLLRFFFRRSLCKSDAVVAEAHEVRNAVRLINGAPSRIEVIPKAVESDYDLCHQALPETMSRYFSEKLGNDAFTFLYVTTYMPHKNIKTLISAIQLLKERGAKVRLVLSVTEEDLSKNIGQQISDLIASGHIIPMGWINKEYLRDLYHSCSACVMPSLIECLSASYLEAMQWGKSQICSDLPFAHEICGPAAIYADPENPRDWADKMLKLMNDHTLRNTLVQEGYERMKIFPSTWIDVAKKLHSLFENMVSHHNQE